MRLTLLFLAFCINFAYAQKKAHTPHDTPIKVYTSINEFCYMPYISQSGKIYLTLGLCSDKRALKARYDVFSRLAYNLSGSWFCVSAPSSVAQGAQTRDYALLTPCVINDKTQQWKLKNGQFYSADESYLLKDDGDYIYAAKKRDTSLRAHMLHNDMQKWLDTIAQPANLSVQTFIAWDLTTRDGNERYFLKNNSSAKDTTPLYYNLESGHIAIYNESAARLDCLYADSEGYEWNWAWWAKCTDEAPPPLNKAFWKFIPTGENRFALVNFQNYALRLTRYGLHWGVPYIVTPSYLQQDTANSPTSDFSLSFDGGEWLRFLNANAGENLPHCPASNDEILSRQKRELKPTPLPSTFRFTSAWRQRFLDIIHSTDGSLSGAGVCGICLLQSFQIVAEILENPTTPRRGGGYFFDTHYGVNPFISFGLRHSLLYDSLNDVLGWFRLFVRRGTPVTPELISINSNNIALASAISLLPQYDWHIPASAFDTAGIHQGLDFILNSPAGSVFILLMDITAPSGRSGAHAVVVIRTQDGTRIIPTNTRMSAEEFAHFSAPVYTREDLLEHITRGGFTLTGLSLLQASAFHTLPFASTVSFYNCEGEGDDRRGSGARPRANLVNQCLSGRCLWR